MSETEVTYQSNMQGIMDAAKTAVEFGVATAVNRVVDRAREKCPVGTITRAGKTWKERKPGTLKSTIFGRVRWMKDGTEDCVGWVKAGTEGAPDKVSAFYAPFVEFGTKKWPQGHPFMRKAFNETSVDDLVELVALEFNTVVRAGVKGK